MKTYRRKLSKKILVNPDDLVIPDKLDKMCGFLESISDYIIIYMVLNSNLARYRKYIIKLTHPEINTF